MRMQRKREQPHHHALIGFGRMARNRERMIGIIMPVHVCNLQVGFENGCFKSHRRNVYWSDRQMYRKARRHAIVRHNEYSFPTCSMTITDQFSTDEIINATRSWVE